MTVRPSRRDVLRTGAALAALAALPGCGPALSKIAQFVETTPGGVGLPKGDVVDPIFHSLLRVAWGPRPGDIEHVREMGRDAWLEQQLDPEAIDDGACDVRLMDCTLIEEPPQELMSVQEQLIAREMARAALIRAVHSRRRILEVMCSFWNDHFSIDMGKKGCMQTKPFDDATVVRRHALGKFRDLLGASAKSSAMLFYLDGASNRGGSASEPPNENYARELMELHTLGVRGGYTQKDVMEAARCLTGWTVEDRGGLRLFHRGEVVFRPDRHDDGAKVVLGHEIPAGGGEADVERLLDLVASHPSTQRRIAWKLCRKLVADPPPESVVALATKEFAATGGDIAATLRQILATPDFETSAGLKVKRPFDFVVTAMRVTGAECRAGGKEIDLLTRMGHVPFRYPTPDGYPEEPEPWMGTLLWRWNFALALATGRLGQSKCDLEALARRAGLDPARNSPADMAPLFLGRAATPSEREAVEAYASRPGGDRGARRREAVALVLAGPGFQVT